jgi:glycosyltransferase involved in cell wall biosynthesis
MADSQVLCSFVSLLFTPCARCKSPAPRYLLFVRISVIVPAFNEEKLLGASLAQIRTAAAAFTARGWEFQLVVCDNNSTDRTTEIARAAGADVIFEPFNQIGRARNTGATAATGDWFIFVDADSHPSRGLFDDVADQITAGHVVAGGATVELDEKMFGANLVTQVWNLTSRLKKWVAGSFIYIQADAFRELGGFNPEIFAAEELELSQRLKTLARARGKKIVILHRHPLKTSARKMKLYTTGEMLRFVLRGIWNRQATVRSREAADLWYDGRR